EESGRRNLLREGIPQEKIHFVGNVMIDALEIFRPRWEGSAIFERLGLGRHQPYGILTLHRPSNVDDPVMLMQFEDAVQALAGQLPIIFPVHPRVKAELCRQLLFAPKSESGAPISHKGVVYLDPLGYLDFVALLSRARLVLTDSGGIQEETTILGVPCLTLR